MQISVEPDNHTSLKLSALELGWLKTALDKPDDLPEVGRRMMKEIVKYKPFGHEESSDSDEGSNP